MKAEVSILLSFSAGGDSSFITMKPGLQMPAPDAVLVSILRKQRSPAYCTHLLQDGGRRHSSRRSIQTSAPKARAVVLSTASISSSTQASAAPPPGGYTEPGMLALATLPLSQVLRTYCITSVSSSPTLLAASTSILRGMLNSRNPLFRIDTNPLMRSLLWHTFYKQFCSGETEAQVGKSCQDLRKQGYAGVILEYALEVLADSEGSEEQDVAVWRKGMLDSVHMAEPGDFIGLKWSGMGPEAMRRMKREQEPTERMSEAMHALCKAAAEKNIALLPAAEETWSLTGFHDWCLRMQRVYNIGGKSVVYSTYQVYLKQTPDIIAKHLENARKEGYTLGVKLVRGAYLGTDDRKLMHSTIEGTHNAYDQVASALIHRKYNDVLRPAEGAPDQALPHVNVVLATHNHESVQKAQSLRRDQAARGELLTPLTFAQLQGMADEVSCSLLAAAKANVGNDKAVQERVFKCTTWGPMFDCLNYLLRRAAENKDAASRTHETRTAMKAELWRRLKGTFYMA
ncbi:proline dehydrogenase [Saxophila tyrrhenica]|uniref:Proline dehydrogenase n=1 Tax=Saxophila tyrrhenica TaxID=1690608 RepID=A0AAV9P037_9PEZI|nr:proline dehydrogenase [Saxophila tyrrhenica]